MPKVNADVGVTIKLGGRDSMDFMRLNCAIIEVDPEGDVDAQIASSKIAITKLFEKLGNEVAEQVAKVRGG